MTQPTSASDAGPPSAGAPSPPASNAPANPAKTLACSELTQLGQRLRQAREQQQLSVDALAERLRLGSDQLLALENADPGRLPEPVFVIAQAKRVAASLDLDLQPEITALRSSAWMAGQGRPKRPALITTPPAAGAGRPGWRRPLGLAALGVVLLGGLALGLSLGQNRLRLLARPAIPSTAAGPATATASSVATGSAQPAPQSGARLRLSVQGKSWVAVRRDDGSTLYQGTLQGVRMFPLGRGVQVLAGRPDLVSAALDGQPLRPMGPIDAVQWRRFTPAPPLSASGTPSPSPATQSQSQSQSPKVGNPNRPGETPTAR